MRRLSCLVKEREYRFDGTWSLSLGLLDKNRLNDIFLKIKNFKNINTEELEIFICYCLTKEYKDIHSVRIQGQYVQAVFGPYFDKDIDIILYQIYDTIEYGIDYSISLENQLDGIKYISIDFDLKEFQKIGIEIENNDFNSYLIKARV